MAEKMYKFFSGLSTWGHMDETYATGEGTEAWCNSNDPMTLPIDIGYRQPNFGNPSCYFIGKGGGNDPNIYAEEAIGVPTAFCAIDKRNNLFFVCS